MQGNPVTEMPPQTLNNRQQVFPYSVSENNFNIPAYWLLYYFISRGFTKEKTNEFHTTLIFKPCSIIELW
jgi:hypothetical protein